MGVARLALVVAVAASTSSVVVTPSLAVIPHEGRYTTKQMAAIVYGYLSAEQTKKCTSVAKQAEEMANSLMGHYGFDLDDIEENSTLGKRFVRMGRRIAAKDSRQADFCDDVQSEISQANAELLPH